MYPDFVRRYRSKLHNALDLPRGKPSVMVAFPVSLSAIVLYVLYVHDSRSTAVGCGTLLSHANLRFLFHFSLSVTSSLTL